MAKIIGIDLGTSNSAAAVMMVGEPARRQAITNPDNTIVAAKRKMGTDHIFKLQGKEYKPQQISAFILQKIKKDSEAFLGEKIEKAVITVPAYFDDNQRQATKDAGTIAGLDVVRIINEPTAASLAFGLDKSKQEMKILVFDFGGGTLDVTIMEMGGGVFEVMSTSGDTLLGGTDMDKVIIDYVVNDFRKKNLEIILTRAKFEELINPIVERCKPSVEKALEDAKLSTSDISKIVLIGGPTRIPLVRKFISSLIGKEAESGVDPMEA